MNFCKFFTLNTIVSLEGDIDKMGVSWCCKTIVGSQLCLSVGIVQCSTMSW